MSSNLTGSKYLLFSIMETYGNKVINKLSAQLQNI